MTKLAAFVLTINEEQHIGDCLDSLAWAERRVVFDSFSTDRTGEIAREHGAEVMQHPFSDYASQRNAACKPSRPNGSSLWMPTNAPRLN
jgi:glycosyltransferase involved in cell wall biosynthesis